jgi:hypothetical protein
MKYKGPKFEKLYEVDQRLYDESVDDDIRYTFQVSDVDLLKASDEDLERIISSFSKRGEC